MCIYVHFFQLGVLPVISLVDGSVQLPGLTGSEFSTKRSPAHLSLSGGEEDSPVTAFILGEMLVQPSKGLSLAHPDHLPFPLNPYSFFLCEKYLLSFNRRENNHVRWVVFPFSIPMRCLGALLARWDYFFFSFFPPFFPPPQLLGRSFTLQLHLRTGCCRRWQVHSCLFPAAGIQRWSSRRGVTPANPSKKKKKKYPRPKLSWILPCS